MNLSHYHALSELLDYPDANYPQRIARAGDILSIKHKEAAREMKVFQKAVESLSAEEMEELFTRTFDMMPVCVPYVSIHLFGEENFKRGEFMARLSRRYEETGFEKGGEFPDHLGVLLRYLAQTGDAEAAELLEFCILAPLERMIQKLDADNPCSHLLRVIETTLWTDFPEITPAPLPIEQAADSHSCASAAGGCGCAFVPSSNTPHLTTTLS